VLIETLAVGLMVGLLLGVLGGGGGVLTVPILVYLLGETPQHATTASLVIVGLTALVGAVARVRSRLVDWRVGLVFGAIGIPTAYLGTIVNRHLDPPVLLLAFAGLIVVVATAMLVSTRRRGEPGHDTSSPDPDGPLDQAPSGGGTALAVEVRPSRTVTALKVVGSALVIGFLTGLLGVGGGFLIVPALVFALRMRMSEAIGTSLLVIAVTSAASIASRVGGAEFDWSVIIPFTLASIGATTVGKQVADRFSGDTLTRAFAVLLLLVAGFVTVQSITAL
jgi:uncharacterized membrane protein YfcA